MRAEVLPVLPALRRGGFGYLVVRLKNGERTARTVGLTLRDETSDERFRIERTVRVEPGERATEFVPFVVCRKRATLELALDGARRGVLSGLGTTTPGGLSVLVVGAGHALSRSWRAFVDDMHALAGRGGASTRRGSAVGHDVTCMPADLPDDWSLLSGFDLVIADGTDRTWDDRSIGALGRFVHGGGTLVLWQPEDLQPCSLRDAALGPAEAKVPDARVVEFGLGTLGSVPAAAIASLPRTDLVVGLFGRPSGLAARLDGEVGGPLPGQAYSRLPVPGVGGLPTHLFFVVILAFVVFAGPINHAFFRRRGQPWLVLLTVPALGAFVTVLILGASLLHEGFGTRGIVLSASVLDQRAHRIVTAATRTLFAALSPPSLTLTADTYLKAGDLVEADGGPVVSTDHRDLDRGLVDGAILPSRRPTSLVTIGQGPCRERLLFRRTANGELEVAAGGLALAGGSGQLVVRDFAGQYFVSRSDGALRPTDPGEAELAMWRLCEAFEALDPDEPARGKPASDWIRDRIARTLVPGSYAARLAEHPAFDHLGLAVDFARGVHVVRGILDDKDIDGG